MNMNNFSVSGKIVDLQNSCIFDGKITIENGKINRVEPAENVPSQYIMPGFTDSHIHVESSMIVPTEFARLAVVHGTVATINDPHEIANVLGKNGVNYMITNAKSSPFKFFFGVPSCVPATCFETSGFTLGVNDVDELLSRDDIYYLAEMMNFPGVINNDAEVIGKIASARKFNKLIDGHAPGLTGKGLEKYVSEGISTDHECSNVEEAEEKIKLGMKILIREGSAAKNFNALIPLVAKYPDKLMFCSDDRHPDELVEGHINTMVKRAVAMGFNVFDVIRAATLNVVNHYKINVGMLREGDCADFIVVDNLNDFNVKKTFINGELVAENGISKLSHQNADVINNFGADFVTSADFSVKDNGKKVNIIEAVEGQLFTRQTLAYAKSDGGFLVSDVENDILKIAVVNRYKKAKPVVGFIRNFGLKRGALASSVAHDSHNIVVIGCSDDEMAVAVNEIVRSRGGIVAVDGDRTLELPLPVAGLMSIGDGYEVARRYKEINAFTKNLGTKMHAPFMTMAFMSLVVIPELKISDLGLFDVKKFCFTDLYEE